MTRARLYRGYVLGLFTVIYAFNFIDRQIVTILAPSLKADLGLTDAQLGLLFGTAFALFYALFGLPLARLADGWNRVATLSLGLAFWSGMTALSGLAGSFVQLAAARMGVGIGEASASPAAISLLQDLFSKARRATALAIYASGIYVGAGASLALGGRIVAWWEAGGRPFGLAGWQAAYLLVGTPGLALALLTWATVREPVRGALDGAPQPRDPHPFRAAGSVAAALFPPFSFWALARAGAGLRAIAGNLVLLGAIVFGTAALVRATDGLLDPARRAAIGQIGGIAVTTNMVQWVAIGLGLYATASWLAIVRRRDPVAARLLGAPAFVALALGGGVLSAVNYGLSAFIFLFASRYLGQGPEAGVALGVIAVIAGGLGTAAGGFLADAARRRHPAGRLWLAIAAVSAAALCLLAQYGAASWSRFLLFHGFATLFVTMWLGPVFATAQDQVPPRMRGTATAVQFLGINLLGLGLGPYLIGLASDAGGDLRAAMLGALAGIPVALALFAFAALRLARAEATLPARAREAGELV